jgi:hypothetical protein
MISTDVEGYLSIIGMSYLHPVTSLLEILEDSSPRGPNEVQASSYENGYSAAIIVLTVLLLESVLSRTQYMRGDKPPKKPLDASIKLGAILKAGFGPTAFLIYKGGAAEPQAVSRR